MKNDKGELLHDDKLDQMWIQPDLDPQRGATKSTSKKSGGQRIIYFMIKNVMIHTEIIFIFRFFVLFIFLLFDAHNLFNLFY